MKRESFRVKLRHRLPIVIVMAIFRMLQNKVWKKVRVYQQQNTFVSLTQFFLDEILSVKTQLLRDPLENSFPCKIHNVKNFQRHN